MPFVDADLKGRGFSRAADGFRVAQRLQRCDKK